MVHAVGRYGLNSIAGSATDYESRPDNGQGLNYQQILQVGKDMFGK
jgi:hypothetical protein